MLGRHSLQEFPALASMRPRARAHRSTPSAGLAFATLALDDFDEMRRTFRTALERAHELLSLNRDTRQARRYLLRRGDGECPVDEVVKTRGGRRVPCGGELLGR